MNPALMWVQAICLALACAVLALTPGHLETLVLTGLLTAVWLVMNATYARSLDGRRRSPERSRRDRSVRRQVVVVLATGLVAGVVGPHLQDLWLWHDRKLWTIAFGALGALAWTIYASSLIDWYYVRPRIDGIVGAGPPCRTSGEPGWGNVTRLWYFHRGVADLLGILAVIVAFSSLVGALVAGGDTLPTAAAVAIPTGAAGAFVVLTQSAIATLRHRVINASWVWVGDELRDDDWRAYVLHLTSRGLLVREWDAEQEDWGRMREVTHERLEAERIRYGRLGDCVDGCSGANPACEWAATDRGAGESARWLVW